MEGREHLVQRVELPEGWVWNRACAEAARFGHLDVLEFLRDEMGANPNFGAAKKQLCDEGGRPEASWRFSVATNTSTTSAEKMHVANLHRLLSKSSGAGRYNGTMHPFV